MPNRAKSLMKTLANNAIPETGKNPNLIKVEVAPEFILNPNIIIMILDNGVKLIGEIDPGDSDPDFVSLANPLEIMIIPSPQAEAGYAFYMPQWIPQELTDETVFDLPISKVLTITSSSEKFQRMYQKCVSAYAAPLEDNLPSGIQEDGSEANSKNLKQRISKLKDGEKLILSRSTTTKQ